MSREWPEILCISVNHWTGLPSTMQHLMQVFGRSSRVLYVDPPIDVFSAIGRPRRWAKFRGLRRVDERIWVLSPVALGNPSDPDARLAFHRRSASRVRRAAGSLGMREPLVWTFAPEHLGYAGALGELALVYHAADEPTATSRRPERTAAIERDLMDAADLVLTASQALLDARAHTGKARRLPNAADRRHFGRVLADDPEATPETLAEAAARPRIVPRALEGLTGPVVLFAGAAYAWFDSELFLSVARARPDWNLVAVGPPGRALPAARLPANVTLAGRRPYGEFPWHVAGCDVGFIPLREGETATNCDPIILHELLLCGKPVVTTPFPAALERGALVRTASTVEECVGAIEEAAGERTDGDARMERVRYGFANTWEDRARTALGYVEEALVARRAREGGAPP